MGGKGGVSTVETGRDDGRMADGGMADEEVVEPGGGGKDHHHHYCCILTGDDTVERPED